MSVCCCSLTLSLLLSAYLPINHRQSQHGKLPQLPNLSLEARLLLKLAVDQHLGSDHCPTESHREDPGVNDLDPHARHALVQLHGYYPANIARIIAYCSASAKAERGEVRGGGQPSVRYGVSGDELTRMCKGKSPLYAGDEHVQHSQPAS